MLLGKLQLYKILVVLNMPACLKLYLAEVVLGRRIVRFGKR